MAKERRQQKILNLIRARRIGTQQELTALLSAAYHIPSNRIYITEAKKSGT